MKHVLRVLVLGLLFVGSYVSVAPPSWAQYSSTVMSLFDPDPDDPYAGDLVALDPFSVSVLAEHEQTISTCADVRSSTADGISGGIAGYETEGESCFSGGGQSFCHEPVSYTYDCAGVTILGTVDIAWAPYDPSEEDLEVMTTDEMYDFYKVSTRDSNRGRAGHTHTLFMNEHGICRAIDNTGGSEEPVFMSVKTAAEWRTVHGVASGANPNGGYAYYANNPDLGVEMSVCCAPILTSVCGVEMATGYAKVGDEVQVFGNGGIATLKCQSNNNYVAVDAAGICGGYGSGGGDSYGSTGGSSGGYANPSNGGTISEADWGDLSAEAQESLSESGYGPSDVDATNEQGSVDAAAAEAEAAEDAAEAEAEAQAEIEAQEVAAQAAAEAAEAEAEAAQAAEDADDDDDGDGGEW